MTIVAVLMLVATTSLPSAAVDSIASEPALCVVVVVVEVGSASEKDGASHWWREWSRNAGTTAASTAATAAAGEEGGKK